MIPILSWPRRLCVTVICLIFLVASTQAAKEVVVTWGADLSADDKAKVIKLMGIQPGKEPLRELVVTNKEEHDLLGEIVPASYIGSRALSSVYVEPLDVDHGIQVSTYNITWVSRRMFAQALVTGGVRDANVIVAAPVPVSGTAALTGIFKAFEAAVGEKLPEEAKRIAGEELYVTKQVGDAVGHEKASRLMERVKEEVISQELTDKAQIIQLIHQLEVELDIKLSASDVEKIADLMVKIKGLNLELDDLEMQLAKVSRHVDQMLSTETGLKGSVRSWLQRLLDLLAQLFERFLSYVGGARSWVIHPRQAIGSG